MPTNINALKKEIELLQEEYELARARTMFDKKQVDHVYKKLKKKKKELDQLLKKK